MKKPKAGDLVCIVTFKKGPLTGKRLEALACPKNLCFTGDGSDSTKFCCCHFDAVRSSTGNHCAEAGMSPICSRNRVIFKEVK